MRMITMGIWVLVSLLLISCASKTPVDVLQSYDEVGLASYYGPKWHGRTTANGEKMDIHAMTAVHKSLPFGTYVKVTILSTGDSVVVRINDRGPFVKGRIIDLSDEAAKQLGLIEKGVARVGLTLLP